MSARDYLTPFAETNRAICDGADERKVLNLITKYMTETLNIKGSFIKIRSPEGEPFEQSEGLGLGRSSFKVRFSQGKKLELLSSYGLSPDFIYSDRCSSPKSILGRIPEETLFVQDLQAGDVNVDSEDLEVLNAEGIRATLLFPIEVDSEKVAYVALFDTKIGDLTRDDVKFARAISSRGVSAFIRIRDLDRLLQRQKLFLRSFQEVSEAINSTLNINKVLEFAARMITNVLGVKGAQIRLLDTKTQKLKLAASHGLSERFTNIGPVASRRRQEGAEMDKIVVIDDVASDSRLQYREEILAEGITKMLTIPLNISEKNIGELTIFTGGERSFSEEEVDFADAIGHQCACAINKAQIYQRVKYEYQQLLEDFGYEGSS
jgi:GAF domain-containing protein